MEVNLPFGNVTVVGWSGPGVRVRQADAGNAPLVRGSASLVAISYAPNISGNSSRGRGSSGSIEVSVPASARISLDIGSGNVSLRGVGGDVEVAARTGDVVLENTGGRVTVSAFAGNLRISGASGPVSADIVAGNISVDGAEGDLDLKTVSGILELSGIKSRLVTASSTSGIVTMEGVLAPDGNYALESFVGVVRLRIPQSSSAIFSLETFSGDIRTAIPMTLESGDSGRQPQQRRILRLGSGNAKVSMKTFSGSVLIERSGG